MVAEIGRVCVKSAGRESGSECVVVEVVDDNFVLIDGPQVKRRRCNLKHLEPSERKVDISEGAPTDEVRKALKEIGSKESEESPKQAGDKQKEPGREEKAQREGRERDTVESEVTEKKSGSKG